LAAEAAVVLERTREKKRKPAKRRENQRKEKKSRDAVMLKQASRAARS
jgi:hypothetical protein